MFESSIEKTVRGKKIMESTIYLVEIATPWTYEGTNGPTFKIAYDKKVTKYQPLIADIERKKPGHKCVQATIIVSPTGAFMRESQEEFAKVSKLDGGKLAIHKRCIVDSCIQGACEQWRQFGHKLRLAAQLDAINPGSAPRIIVPNPEEARPLAELILADSPDLSVDVNVQSRGEGSNEVVAPDVGIISPIELYEASVQELNSCVQDGRRQKPLESHPDGYVNDPDDGNDAMFGRRFIDKREKRKDPVVELVPYQPMLPPKPIGPKDQTVEVEFGLYGN
jgi:hypothetical protein